MCAWPFYGFVVGFFIQCSLSVMSRGLYHLQIKYHMNDNLFLLFGFSFFCSSSLSCCCWPDCLPCSYYCCVGVCLGYTQNFDLFAKILDHINFQWRIMCMTAPGLEFPFDVHDSKSQRNNVGRFVCMKRSLMRSVYVQAYAKLCEIMSFW